MISPFRWSIYLREGKVYVPTTVQIVKGPLLEMEPVGVTDGINISEIELLVKTVVARGNSVVPLALDELREMYRKPVLLGYAKVKTWKAFEKNCFYWGLSYKDSIYTISPSRKDATGEWVKVSDKVEVLPAATPLEEVARRVALQIKEICLNPRANP